MRPRGAVLTGGCPPCAPAEMSNREPSAIALQRMLCMSRIIQIWSSAMSVKRIVPDITSKHLDASRRFYVDVLGLEVAMDMGFIVTLVSPGNPTAQISLLRDDDSSTILPQISIEVADVDDVHSRAVSQGLNIVYPLTNEPWGVRRFFVTDPNGIVINVMCHM